MLVSTHNLNVIAPEPGSPVYLDVIDGEARVTKDGRDYTRWTVDWFGVRLTVFVWDEQAAMAYLGIGDPKGIARHRGYVRASVKPLSANRELNKVFKLDRFDVLDASEQSIIGVNHGDAWSDYMAGGASA